MKKLCVLLAKNLFRDHQSKNFLWFKGIKDFLQPNTLYFSQMES